MFYSQKGIINVGDMNYPVDLKYYLEKFGYTWHYWSSVGKDSGVGLSYNSYFFLPIILGHLGLSVSVCQAISFTFLYYLAFLSTYLLARKCLKMGQVSSFIGAFFYILNPFFIAQWYVPIPWNLSNIVMIPFVCLTLSLFWQKRPQLFFALFLIFLFFSYASANTPLMLVTFISYFSFTLFYSFYVSHRLELRNIITINLILLFSYCLANFWWLFPGIFSIFSIYRGYEQSMNIKDWSFSVSRLSSILNIFSYRFVLPLNRFEPDLVAYLRYYFSPLADSLSYTFIVLIFLPITLNIKRLRIHWLILYLLFLISIFFTKAINPPFRSFYLALYDHVPFFGVFKSAPEKFGSWFVFLSCLIIIFSLDYLNKNYKLLSRVAVAISIIALASYSYPLFTARIISPINIGQYKLTPFYNEPDEMVAVRNRLNDDPRYSRVLYYNGTDNYVVTTDLGNGEYFRGLDSIAFNTNKAFVQQFNSEYGLAKKIFSTPPSPSLFNKLPEYDIDYILFNRMNVNFNTQDYFDEILENREMILENYEEKMIGDRILLYHIKENKDIPKIFAVDNFLEYEENFGKCLFPKNSFQTPKLTFERVNPSKYKIFMDGVKKPFCLVFNEGYSHNWKAYVSMAPKDFETLGGREQFSYYDGKVIQTIHSSSLLNWQIFETFWKIPVAEANHHLFNGYANMWRIEPGEDSALEITIEYLPQRRFYLGLLATMTTFLLIVLFLIWKRLKLKK